MMSTLPGALLALQPPAGVVFDMDGTLTVPCIDFDDMRTRVFAIAGVDSGDSKSTSNLSFKRRLAVNESQTGAVSASTSASCDLTEML